MLLAAFIGDERWRSAYAHALERGISVPLARRLHALLARAVTPAFVVEAVDGAARTGTLTTAHGAVRTPAFMPVGTHATVKALHPDEVRATGVDILLCNAYHLALRPGIDLIERAGGLHAFMGWDHPILTDSGGYQLVSLVEVAAVDDDGATFVSPYDGSRLRVTPEEAVRNQARLGADVLMCLDHPVAHGTATGDGAGGDRAHPPLGGALPGGAPGRWPPALRHRPGRIRRRARGASRRDSCPGSTSTAWRSVASRWGSPSRPCSR